MNTYTPNLIICSGFGSETSSFKDVLESHPEINFIADDDINTVKIDDTPFPPLNFDPLFTNDIDSGNVLETIARKYAGKSRYIGWQPQFAIEFPHVLWTTIETLPDAKFIFCLRNPYHAAYIRYLSIKENQPSTFEEAIELCEKEMVRISQFKNRNKWSSYINNPSILSLLIQSSVYYPSVNRTMKFIPKENIHIVIYENYIEDSTTTLNNIQDFLKLQNKFDVSTYNAEIKQVHLEYKISRDAIYLLDKYIKEFNSKLEKLLNINIHIWDMNSG